MNLGTIKSEKDDCQSIAGYKACD